MRPAASEGLEKNPESVMNRNLKGFALAMACRAGALLLLATCLTCLPVARRSLKAAPSAERWIAQATFNMGVGKQSSTPRSATKKPCAFNDNHSESISKKVQMRVS